MEKEQTTIEQSKIEQNNEGSDLLDGLNLGEKELFIRINKEIQKELKEKPKTIEEKYEELYEEHYQLHLTYRKVCEKYWKQQRILKEHGLDDLV